MKTNKWKISDIGGGRWDCSNGEHYFEATQEDAEWLCALLNATDAMVSNPAFDASIVLLKAFDKHIRS